MKQKNFLQEATLAQQCYESLQDAIVGGELAPGQKLKMDSLKKRLSVGQSPIREALSRLVASGLVDVYDNKGFWVAAVSEADVRDIYRTFTQIEVLALTQAIKLGDAAWEASIVAALHHLSVIENQQEPVLYQAWSARNYDFHVALISGCDSPTLLQVRSDLYKRFDRYCRIAFNATKKQLDVNYKEHKKLAELVIKRDEKAAQALLENHMRGAMEDVLKVLKNNDVYAPVKD